MCGIGLAKTLKSREPHVTSRENARRASPAAPKTHLAYAYEKLGLASWTQLAAACHARTPTIQSS
jgi:hypothetical protein